jgi:hypothetical protein
MKAATVSPQQLPPHECISAIDLNSFRDCVGAGVRVDKDRRGGKHRARYESLVADDEKL